METIVFLRHSEKQPGIGPIDLPGLNRALALPPVLIANFGRADYVFAPAPEGKVTEGGLRRFDYIRPLATIEPTAIGWAYRFVRTVGIKILPACNMSLRNAFCPWGFPTEFLC
jgi:hypothetical protein